MNNNMNTNREYNMESINIPITLEGIVLLRTDTLRIVRSMNTGEGTRDCMDARDRGVRVYRGQGSYGSTG